MTHPATSESIPEPDLESESSVATEAEEPQPLPWTAERVSEWNAYYDVYVILAVLLLVFVASANKITHSSIWNQLQVGRAIAAGSAPIKQDIFSFTQTGASWVNIPWLFDLSQASLYKVAYDLTPIDANDTIASAAKADQIAAGTLVALNALARLLTALILLQLRRAGPGRWWSAFCVTLALGAVLNPVRWFPVLGGIAGAAVVSPSTWGLLFFATEIWLIHRASRLGSARSAFAIIPLFALWANVDETFLFGLMVLAAFSLGRLRPPKGEASCLTSSLTILGLSVLACLVNPATFHVYGAAAEPFLSLFRPGTESPTTDQLSFFGSGIRTTMGAGWTRFAAYYLILVAIGFASFFVNRKRFALDRFLVYTFAAVLWGALIRFSPEFAVVFAVTLALNGQEWYLDNFGAQGRLGMGWSLWSVGGRLITIGLTFGCVFMALTGLGATPGEAQFGFGFDRDEFAFEAADFLKNAPLEGNILNSTQPFGDALIWRAYPERKTFIDSRPHLFPRALRNRLQETRKALSEDDVEGWKPLLDEYKISSVMIPPFSAPNTYRILSQSPNWIPFYDDGTVVLFGRVDGPENDVAFFKENRLDPDTIAYKRTRTPPPSDRPPTPVDWMDEVFQTRALMRTQPHAEAARRWLAGPDFLSTDDGSLPDPARCLIAIREARTALAAKPDDTQAFRILASAYRSLMIQETAILAGLELTPANLARVSQNAPRSDLLMTRFRQRVTALSYAIQTTPPPKDAAATRELNNLNLELFQLFLSTNFLDLARDRLQFAVSKMNKADYTPEIRTRFSQDLAQLNEQIKQIQNRMSDLTTDQQYGPMQLASFALGQGAPGLAIQELAEAERTGVNPALVKPQLLDLYVDTGQPDKAVEMLSSGTVEDPTFGTEPGVSPMRQGRAYFLMGNPEYAATLWEKYAIPRIRLDRSRRALGGTQAIIQGEVKAATSSLLEIPEKVRTQAAWEFDAGLSRLEGGVPELAAEHFTKSLTLVPNFAFRRLIAYYLAKLEKPVPPAEKLKDPEKPQPEPAPAK